MKPLLKKLLLTTTPAILVGAGGTVLAERQVWPEPISRQLSFQAATQAASRPAPRVEAPRVEMPLAGERL